jgi:hypothetical protein
MSKANKNGEPSEKGTDGRDKKSGQFAKGWKGGPGNPWASKTLHFRTMVLETVTDEDMVAVIQELTKQAKLGKPWAVKEFFDRVIGKASQPLEVDASVDSAETRELLVKYLRDGLKAA